MQVNFLKWWNWERMFMSKQWAYQPMYVHHILDVFSELTHNATTTQDEGKTKVSLAMKFVNQTTGEDQDPNNGMPSLSALLPPPPPTVPRKTNCAYACLMCSGVDTTATTG